ncbi:unnamed protein product [Caenorhabditis sp. 36 PRJEB53466]|nr:unnamed protein product [Caenorhabditis sp. 36 PRJEB53466]
MATDGDSKLAELEKQLEMNPPSESEFGTFVDALYEVCDTVGKALGDDKKEKCDDKTAEAIEKLCKDYDKISDYKQCKTYLSTTDSGTATVVAVVLVIFLLVVCAVIIAVFCFLRRKRQKGGTDKALA